MSLQVKRSACNLKLAFIINTGKKLSNSISPVFPGRPLHYLDLWQPNSAVDKSSDGRSRSLWHRNSGCVSDLEKLSNIDVNLYLYLVLAFKFAFKFILFQNINNKSSLTWFGIHKKIEWIILFGNIKEIQTVLQNLRELGVLKMKIKIKVLIFNTITKI